MFRRIRRLFYFIIFLAVGFLLWQGPSNGQTRQEHAEALSIGR